MTALDIASAGAKDNPNWAIIEQKLEEAGGVRLSVMSKYSTKSDSSGIIDPRNANVSKEVGDKDIVNTQIVVASLIATVTFAAIFQIPGGIEDDDKESVHYGVAKMAFHKLFKFFILCDIAACITSLTVVVVWLLRSVLRDTSFGVTVALSRNSVWTLIASIFWTAAAFVSATMIVTVPSNYENLKSTHKKAYSQYFQLLKGELFIPIFSAFYVCMSFLYLVVAVPGHIGFAKIYIWIHVSVITFFILKFTFSK
ncbi:hypothetical protein SUGI_0546810 [Cryptomeria japonica]|nr:hypothetical protein SUGI_0546810 [Cryptomeria japonica]